MKVLFLNYEYPPLGGGAANATYYILKEFSRENDIEIDLVTSSAGSEFEIEEMGAGVRIHKLPVNKNEIHYWTQKEILVYSWKAYRYAKKLDAKDYDLIHTFFGFPCGAIAYLLKKDVPYIVSLRGSDVPGFNNRFSLQYVFLKPIIKKVWKSSDAVIANSKGLKELALKTDSDVNIGVIYNGIKLEEFNPELSESKDSVFTILTVARLIERKGIDDLIKAIAMLVKDNVTDIRLKIIGKGNMEASLKALSQELDVAEFVDFLEYVPHDKLPLHYSSSDVFVLPSKYEGMSNTVLEAMASGLPVIVTDTGGTAELVNGNGTIVPAKSPSELKGAIAKYYKNPDLKNEHGAKSRKIAEKLTWNEVMKGYLDVYRMVL
ncbi:glycosyltransferase family 4 protein [Methanolobus sp. ZRKC2]|uniref:glycosyltransferase family 4 protein n=1 Tax=Methanolobus sp. ZRKC2 TaxID=3125783 RepID=UPI003248F7CD